ncbi:hypothetical protein ABT010_40290 [Streptomyces sp. NPDC002668]|uniref:hypothetical protein n=1 Tax=Streptomyces sp. NPDC002668 TaxID=3154422 RepID=UPI003320818F
MSTPLARPLPVSIFKDDEPVVQSHSLLPDADPPVFGHRGIWDFNGVSAAAPTSPSAAGGPPSAMG